MKAYVLPSFPKLGYHCLANSFPGVHILTRLLGSEKERRQLSLIAIVLRRINWLLPIYITLNFTHTRYFPNVQVSVKIVTISAYRYTASKLNKQLLDLTKRNNLGSSCGKASPAIIWGSPSGIYLLGLIKRTMMIIPDIRDWGGDEKECWSSWMLRSHSWWAFSI